ncbi:MAG: response regulator [Ignavibacteriaceae bacterium]|jgi:two-component system chemotaxis response regulator CheY|nr:response regulator [Melioribacteraceae bacterium]MDX9924073.1 response regulator [Ignavibacteriaceae bacterium]
MKRVILVADDSPTIRKFVSVALTVKGYDIISCSDGMEALEKLPNNKIDLLITDLNMPNVDGFELINIVRNNSDLKELPIIVLSSLGSNDDIQRGLECGANSYLIKPFDPKRVLYEVSKYLN